MGHRQSVHLSSARDREQCKRGPEHTQLNEQVSPQVEVGEAEASRARQYTNWGSQFGRHEGPKTAVDRGPRRKSPAPGESMKPATTWSAKPPACLGWRMRAWLPRRLGHIRDRTRGCGSLLAPVEFLQSTKPSSRHPVREQRGYKRRGLIDIRAGATRVEKSTSLHLLQHGRRRKTCGRWFS